jgi:thiamine-monophosphate kinase
VTFWRLQVFGKSSAGLRLLLGSCVAEAGLRKALLEAVFLPKAPLLEGLALSKCGAVSASIDSSDGLAWSIHELSRLSKVGFVIDRVPTAEEANQFAKLNGLDPSELALYGGEEYELVVTVRPEKWTAALAAVKQLGQLLPSGVERAIVLELEAKNAIEALRLEHFRAKFVGTRCG